MDQEATGLNWALELGPTDELDPKEVIQAEVLCHQAKARVLIWPTQKSGERDKPLLATW
jgi:hypothetical protein